MTIQKTLSIIKPDAVRKNNIGAITQRFEKAGLKVIAARMEKLTIEQAEKFYEVHKERPFFNELVDFICSGPVMIQILEGPNAILRNRELMGATDPKQADQGTIRADFAESVGQNAVHGSDSIDTARQEIAFFFTQNQCFSEGFSNECAA
jgi:nucleoside-diphosphate kinase